MLGGCCYGACDAMPRREAKAEAIPRRAKNEASERGRFGARALPAIRRINSVVPRRSYHLFLKQKSKNNGSWTWKQAMLRCYYDIICHAPHRNKQ